MHYKISNPKIPTDEVTTNIFLIILHYRIFFNIYALNTKHKYISTLIVHRTTDSTIVLSEISLTLNTDTP